jgi:hypothetical protein
MVVPLTEASLLIVVIMEEYIGRALPADDPLNPPFSEVFASSSPAHVAASVAKVKDSGGDSESVTSTPLSMMERGNNATSGGVPQLPSPSRGRFAVVLF